MPQRAICQIAIINKSSEDQCNFFVVPGNKPALLGMFNCKWLVLLNVSCQNTSDQHEE